MAQDVDIQVLVERAINLGMDEDEALQAAEGNGRQYLERFIEGAEDDREDDRGPSDAYAVVAIGDDYAIKPISLVKDSDNVVTRTITIETANAYLADLLDDDDDPRCVCGVYRSEHILCGCSEGFQRQGSWAVEREYIQHMSDDQYESIYGWN